MVAIPKTMDNDVPGTDYCVGFSTAVTRTIQMTTIWWHQLALRAFPGAEALLRRLSTPCSRRWRSQLLV